MRKFSDVHLRDLTPMLSPLLGQQTQFADRPATIAIVVLAAGRAASAAGDVRHVRAFWHTLAYRLADCFPWQPAAFDYSGRSFRRHRCDFMVRVDSSADETSTGCLISQKRVQVHIDMVTVHEIGSP
jgi:hypothetical protein